MLRTTLILRIKQIQTRAGDLSLKMERQVILAAETGTLGPA
jgi:hypothetical protein